VDKKTPVMETKCTHSYYTSTLFEIHSLHHVYVPLVFEEAHLLLSHVILLLLKNEEIEEKDQEEMKEYIKHVNTIPMK
jgi:hypothetical protein